MTERVSKPPTNTDWITSTTTKITKINLVKDVTFVVLVISFLTLVASAIVLYT